MQSDEETKSRTAADAPVPIPGTFYFRIRMSLGQTSQIVSDQHFIIVNPPDEVQVLWISGESPQQALSDSRTIVLRGGPYETAELAGESSERWATIARTALPHIGVGADFSNRVPRSFFTKAGLELWGTAHDRTLLNDEPGPLVFQVPEGPFSFVSGSATARVGKQEDRVLEAFAKARTAQLVEGVEHLLAYDFFSASFFQGTADARFMMLMMSLESLIQPQDRSPAAVSLVRQLIAVTENSQLDKTETDSITGSLSWLLQESIGQAGRRLVSRLEPQRYNEMSPKRFFTHCYEIRSRLIHGNPPAPSFDEVNQLAGTLELFVGDLLALPLLRTPNQ